MQKKIEAQGEKVRLAEEQAKLSAGSDEDRARADEEAKNLINLR